jgi:hypothetical protein
MANELKADLILISILKEWSKDKRYETASLVKDQIIDIC